ncbi:MAG: hypothetical protein IJX27_01095 [Clostridia bacterium]|nr:hypothetical protein [Clostridia bacterium]
MNILKYREKIITGVAEEMISFMRDCEEDGVDAGYTEDDVEECKEILFDYIDALDELEDPTDEDIMAEVENVIVALNELNANTDDMLIETVEREAICEIIQDAAVECGLEEEYDDVTEEWREW